MLLNLTDLSSEPLHRQISRQIRAKILSGDLSVDDPLPSIRGLARDHRVSVITVQRAYETLDRDGLIQARRGKGFYVVPLSDHRKRDMAEERFAESLTRLLTDAQEEGLTRERITEIFSRCIGR